MKVCIAQLNPTVGDLRGNLTKLGDALSEAETQGADILVTPELFLTGYPPRDLLERRSFLDSVNNALQELASMTADKDCSVLLGTPYEDVGCLFNAALLYECGKLTFRQYKTLLPTYDVFDEKRYFTKSTETNVFKFRGEKIGVTICEDAWGAYPDYTGRSYSKDPVAELAKLGATIIFNLSASPFQVGKDQIRNEIFSSHAKRTGVPFVFTNQVGANDELVFDGTSMAYDGDGRIIATFSSFSQEVKMIDTSSDGYGSFSPLEPVHSIHAALVLGLSDYMKKTGFTKALVGLSGGIDSAVTLTLACNALGPENVLAVTMPGPYSSTGSVTDSRELARRLGVTLLERDIVGIYDDYVKALSNDLGNSHSIALENVQARIRVNLLMALSNEFGHLVLSSGNKSELAVGYCTLYGDMSGGLALISDVPKTMIYKLANFINRDSEIIPQIIVEKPPSAELAPDQIDQDTLPPYDVLDAILEGLIDHAKSSQDLVDAGFDSGTVYWVATKVRLAEHKRRQAAPGIKVTSKAFGMGHRIPIAASYQL